MFIWSFKMSKRELIIIGVGLVAFIVTAVLLLVLPSGSEQSSVLVSSGYSLSADNAQERTAFLSQFGWKTEDDPVAVKEIIIPKQLNERYEQYNQLQKQQGFDLSALGGERVKLWTYSITNYPGVNNGVVANLLILDGTVVGGDICSTDKNGFMHGFDPHAFSSDISNAKNLGTDIDRTVPDNIPEQSDAAPENDGDDE